MLDFTFGSRQNSFSAQGTSSNPFMKINNQILNSSNINTMAQKHSFNTKTVFSSVLKQLFEVISYNFEFLQKRKISNFFNFQVTLR